MKRHVICRASEFSVGTRRIVPVGGRGGIGVFNVGGRFFALRNTCPHQGGPLCLGDVTGTTEARFEPGEMPGVEWSREGEILRCPWHGWEFDLRTGRTVFRPGSRVSTYRVYVDDPSRVEGVETVDTFPVHVEEGWVVVEYR